MAGMFGSSYQDAQEEMNNLATMYSGTGKVKLDDNGIMQPPKKDDNNPGNWWSWYASTIENTKNKYLAQALEDLKSTNLSNTPLGYQEGMLEGLASTFQMRDEMASMGVAPTSNGPVIPDQPEVSVEPLDVEPMLTFMDQELSLPNSIEASIKRRIVREDYDPLDRIRTRKEEMDTGISGLMSPTDTAEEEEPSQPVREGEVPVGKKLVISDGTRAQYKPTKERFNISMDYNSAKGGRGTEVIIPDDASPETRAAAERFNEMVIDFAAKHGYTNYKNRGVKTRSENKRGVSNTVHAEPFFAQDTKMAQIVKDNLDEFASIYVGAFGDLSATLVAPHGVDKDRGAVSDVFGTETDYGMMILNSLTKK